MPEHDSSAGDHEVIESAEALFHHLYEAHGVEEAGDLDPDLTPVEPWLRRHAELERAARRQRAQAARAEGGAGARPATEPPWNPAAEPEPRAATRPRPGDPGGRVGLAPDPERQPVPQGGRDARPPVRTGRGPERPGQARATRLFDQQRPDPEAGEPARPARLDQGQSQSRYQREEAGGDAPDPGDGLRRGGLRDPLVRALVAELVRSGHDERAVRRYVHRYVALTPEGGLTGEAGIRASFLDPILEVIAEQLDPIAVRAEPAGSGSASGSASPQRHGDRRSAEEAEEAEEAQEDLMAIANVFRRRQAEHSAS